MSPTAYCIHCGARIPENAAYCPVCGKPQAVERPVSPRLAPVPAADPIADPAPAPSGASLPRSAAADSRRPHATMTASVLALTGILDIGLASTLQSGAQLLNNAYRIMTAAGVPTPDVDYTLQAGVALITAIAALLLAIKLLIRPTRFALDLTFAMAGAQALFVVVLIATIGLSAGSGAIVIVPAVVVTVLAYSARSPGSSR